MSRPVPDQETAQEAFAYTPLDEPQPSLQRRMRAYYNSSTAYLEDLARHDDHYLDHYVTFVCQHVALGSTVLDLGCGTGRSAQLLCERGYHAIGVDFSRLFLRHGRGQSPAQPLICADLLDLPVGDGLVDAVAGMNFIEHITDVPRCLREAWRVLRPGGRMLLAGPNLCSPFFPLADLVRLVIAGRGRPVFAESSRAAWRWLFHNIRLSWRKLRLAQPQFLYRHPDLSERHVGGDSDSTYLACPIDFARYFATVPNARVLQLSTGTRLRSRIVARALPHWSPFLGVVVEKTR